MRNRWWLLTIVLVVFTCQLVQAQEQPERAVITPENAADLQAVKLIGQGEFTGKPIWTSDGRYIIAASTIGVWIYTADAWDIPPRFIERVAAQMLVTPDNERLILAVMPAPYQASITHFEVWDMEKLQLLNRLTPEAGVYEMTYDPVKNAILYFNGSRTIHWIDLETGEETTRNFSYTVNRLALSPDGTMLAVSSDGRPGLIIWNTADWSIRHTLRIDDMRFEKPIFSLNGTHLVAFSNSEQKLHMWELSSETIVWSVDSNGIRDFAFRPVSGQVIASNVGVTMWNTSLVFSDESAILALSPAIIEGVAYSPNGERLVALEAQSLQIWSMPYYRATLVLQLGERHTPLPTALAFSPASDQLAISSPLVQVWDISSEQPVARFDAPRLDYLFDLTFSPDGTLIAGSGMDDCTPYEECNIGATHIWDVATGHSVRLKGWGGQTDIEIRDLAFTPDGQWLATSNPLSLWQVSNLFEQPEYTREQASQIWEIDSSTDYLAGDRSSIEISPDGRWLISAGLGGIIRFYDLVSREESRQIDTGHQAIIYAIFSPDGQKMVAAVNETTYSQLYISGGEQNEDPATWTNTLRLYDVETGEELAVLAQTEASMTVVAFSPYGRLLAVGLDDGTVRLWDVESRRPVTTLQKADTRIMDIAFSPDGTWLAVAQSDGATWLWAVTEL